MFCHVLTIKVNHDKGRYNHVDSKTEFHKTVEKVAAPQEGPPPSTSTSSFIADAILLYTTLLVESTQSVLGKHYTKSALASKAR